MIHVIEGDKTSSHNSKIDAVRSLLSKMSGNEQKQALKDYQPVIQVNIEKVVKEIVIKTPDGQEVNGDIAIQIANIIKSVK